MDQQAAAIRYSHWEEIVLEANRSGIPKREWCKQNGLSEKAFYYWQRKVRARVMASAELPPALPEPQHAFVELPFSSSASVTDRDSDSLENPPELMLQVGDCRMFITGSVKETTLRTVLKVIRDA